MQTDEVPQKKVYELKEEFLGTDETLNGNEKFLENDNWKSKFYVFNVWKYLNLIALKGFYWPLGLDIYLIRRKVGFFREKTRT